jgi:SAM-dependent methyltransferase
VRDRAPGQGAPAPRSLSSYDLPTLDKLPVIQRLMAAEGDGLALDIGVGTGYTTSRVFGARPTVCVDVDAGTAALSRHAAAPGTGRRLYVLAEATALPFRSNVFRFALASEVFEHLADDRAAAGELARVLAPGGRAVLTVPYTGLGFTSFLELARIPTVHDVPGPEFHVRPGYHEEALRALLAPHGLRMIAHAYYLRLFTRAATDLVSLAHLLYQRLVHRRRSWTWADLAGAERGIAFRAYRAVFPLLRAWSRLDRVLAGRRGFGLVAAFTKEPAGP